MDKNYIPDEVAFGPEFGCFSMNEKGQTYGEWLSEKKMIEGSARLRDAILKFLKERKA
jgi:hypothetical protein